jgi:hypothetical protein
LRRGRRSLFALTVVIQGITRAGFDFRLHAPSQLSLGGLGWIQVTNFVVSGLLFVAAAVGMRRALHPGRAGTWGPVLVGAFGVSLVWAGIFPTDPANGFPPGTATAEQMSWHGALHLIGPTGGGLALLAASLVFARRFAGLRQWAWMTYSITAVVADLLLASAGGATSDLRLTLAGGVALWLWTSITSSRSGGSSRDQPIRIQNEGGSVPGRDDPAGNAHHLRRVPWPRERDVTMPGGGHLDRCDSRAGATSRRRYPHA